MSNVTSCPVYSSCLRRLYLLFVSVSFISVSSVCLPLTSDLIGSVPPPVSSRSVSCQLQACLFHCTCQCPLLVCLSAPVCLLSAPGLSPVSFIPVSYQFQFCLLSFQACLLLASVISSQLQSYLLLGPNPLQSSTVLSLESSCLL